MPQNLDDIDPSLGEPPQSDSSSVSSSQEYGSPATGFLIVGSARRRADWARSRLFFAVSQECQCANGVRARAASRA